MPFDPSRPATPPHDERPPRRPLVIAAAMTALIGAFYLLREHWSHVVGSWPYLLLLACPVMHLFHRHGGHDHAARPGRSADLPSTKDD